MSRPRIPSNIIKLRGSQNTRKNHADREHEPVPSGPFPVQPPPHLTAAVRAAWCEIVGVTAPGVLTRSDVLIVEVCARLLAKFRADDVIKPSLVQRLTVELGKLGLSPSDRARLRVPRPKQNPYRDL